MGYCDFCEMIIAPNWTSKYCFVFKRSFADNESHATEYADALRLNRHDQLSSSSICFSATISVAMKHECYQLYSQKQSNNF